MGELENVIWHSNTVIFCRHSRLGFRDKLSESILLSCIKPTNDAYLTIINSRV